MSSRREFLRIAGTVTAGAAATLAPTVRAAGTPPRWTMVVDLAKCVGCQACTVACTLEHDVPAGQYRTTVQLSAIRTAGGTAVAMLPRLCNHCDAPACVPVCPAGATYKTADGTVQIDADRCLGCGLCAKACPYEARYVNAEAGKAEKCSLCVHRLEAGLLPACVETCAGGARQVGDRNDPQGVVARALAAGAQVLIPEAGTQPSVCYLGLDRVAPRA